MSRLGIEGMWLDSWAVYRSLFAGRGRMDGMGKRTKMDRTEFLYKAHPAAEMD